MFRNSAQGCRVGDIQRIPREAADDALCPQSVDAAHQCGPMNSQHVRQFLLGQTGAEGRAPWLSAMRESQRASCTSAGVRPGVGKGLMHLEILVSQ